MENNFEIIAEEQQSDYSNDNLFNITSWGADISLRELISSYEEGDIVKPELQRNYVWDKAEASRFIESILMGLPVPSIFLANDKNNRKLIVDGYQRIMTICDYKRGVWGKDNSPFKLINSDKINTRWRNKGYNELEDDDQRRFRLYTIHAIIFEQKRPQNDDGLYQIFERINTSVKTLNPQEIRNCVYQGSLNSLLFRLNRNTKWRAMFGDTSDNARMLDIEFILRFFALSDNDDWINSSGRFVLKKLLNEYMGNHKEANSDFITAKETEFNEIIDVIYDSIGERAFHNLQNDLSTLRNNFNPTVFDSIMIATQIAVSRNCTIPNDLPDRRLSMLKDTSYRESITQGTMVYDNIKNRVAKALYYLFDCDL